MYKPSSTFVSILLLTIIPYNDSAVTAPVNSTASIRIAPRPHSFDEQMSSLHRDNFLNVNSKPSHQIKSNTPAYKKAISSNYASELLKSTKLELEQIRKAKEELDEAERKIIQQNEKKKFNDVKSKKTKVKILEPPNNSYIWGRHFHVRVKIESGNKEKIKHADSKICTSLDKSPWYCWPVLNARIHFVNATEVGFNR